MGQLNPYASPQTHEQLDASAAPSEAGQKPILPWLILSAFAGAVSGSILLSPSVRGVGDPTGQSIGAGLGGFAGLGVTLLLFFARSVARRFFQKPSTPEA